MRWIAGWAAAAGAVLGCGSSGDAPAADGTTTAPQPGSAAASSFAPGPGEDLGTHPDPFPSPDPPPTFECDGNFGVLTDDEVVITDGPDDELPRLDDTSVIDGSLRVEASAHADLDWLGCITEIRGRVLVTGNPNLASLAGSDGLRAVTNDLVITANPALTELDGFEEVAQLGAQDPVSNELFPGSLEISGNDSLTAITGLTSLAIVYNDVTISGNPMLSDISGLAGLQGIGASLTIVDNPALCDSTIDAFLAGISAAQGPVTRSGNGDC